MAEAQVAVKQASDNMAAAQAALGEAAARGNKQAADALKGYENELKSAQSLLQQYVAANAEAQAAARKHAQEVLQLRIELEHAKAATQEFKTQQAEASAATRSATSATMAASAELRILEGNIQGSTRAAGRLLATLPGIGAAAQAAFSVFGVIALVEVLGQAAGAVRRLMEAYDALDGAAIRASTDAILAGEKIVGIKAEQFDANAFARMVAGAPVQPEVTVQNASAKLREIEYAKDLAEAQAQVNEQGLTGVALQRQKIADIEKEINFAREAKAQADALVESYRKQLEAKTTIVTEIPTKNRMVRSEQTINTITDPKQVEAIQQQLKTAVSASQEFNHQLDMMQVKLQGAGVKLPRIEDKDAAKAKGDFVAELISYDKDIEESGKRVNEALTASFDKMYDEDMQAAKLQDEQRKAATREYLEGEKQVLKIAEQNIDAAHEVAKARLEAQQVSITAVRASGLSSPEAELDQMKALHKAELKEEQDYLTAKIELMKKDPDADPTQLNQLQAKLTVSQQGTAPLINAKDNLAQMKLVADTFKNSVNQMNQEFNSAIDGWLRGTERFSQAFTRMADDMAITFVNNLLKMGEQWVQHEVMKLAIHTATNEGIMTQDQAAAALSQATSAKSTLEQITHYAALAAAKAYSALADIPVVGPALGAIAAGATFVAVEALAAFDKGTSLIPRDGIAMLHKGEAVLPPPQTDALMDALGAGSRGSKPGSSFRDFNLTYHGGQSTGPEDMFSMARKHSRLMNWSQ